MQHVAHFRLPLLLDKLHTTDKGGISFQGRFFSARFKPCFFIKLSDLVFGGEESSPVTLAHVQPRNFNVTF